VAAAKGKKHGREEQRAYRRGGAPAEPYLEGSGGSRASLETAPDCL